MAAGIDVQHSSRVGRSADRQGDRTADRSGKRDDLVLVDQFARFLRTDAGIAPVVFLDQFDLSTHDAAARVPYIGGHLEALDFVFT